MIRKTIKPTPDKTLDSAIQFTITNSTKAADGSLYIEGYANTIDKDRVNDKVLPEAFRKSLALFLENPVLLLQHNWDMPIGTVVEAKIDEKGLWIKAKISNSKDCEDVRTKIMEGVYRTFSIGYNEIDSEYDEASQTKIVKDIELLEISVVTIPANPAAKFKPSGSDAPAPAADVSAPASEEPAKSLVSDLQVIKQGLQSISESLNSFLKEKELMKTPVTKTTETPAAADPSKKDEGGAPMAAADPAAAAPAAEPAAAPAMDPAKVMEVLAAVQASLASMAEQLGQVLEGVKGMNGKMDAVCKELEIKMDEAEEPKPAEGEGEKPVEAMSDEEAEKELEQIVAEMEGLATAE